MSIDARLQQITDRHAELTSHMSGGKLEGDKSIVDHIAEMVEEKAAEIDAGKKRLPNF